MKTYYEIENADLRQIKVGGWIKDFLLKQKDGITGNLQKIGYPFNKECWKDRSLTDGGYEQWWPYEQTAYEIDAVTLTAAVLDDYELFSRVKQQIDSSVIDDGEKFMGPVELKYASECNRWPHAVFFRALWTAYLYTGNQSYIRRMREHYLSDEADYSGTRDITNIECMYKLAALYDDYALKDKADKAIKKFNEKGGITSPGGGLSQWQIHEHGVTVNEEAKLGAVAYLYTGNEAYLNGSVSLYEKLNDFHMLPDGVNSSYEKTSGADSFKMHESCDISDETYSLGFLLKATGNGKYADRIERACFNALPGATAADFKAIQYLSCVNQVICARNSTHLKFWRNTPRIAYQPHHYPECCVANIGRAMPNYAMNMYGDTRNGVSVNLYGESAFDGKNIKIRQETKYPFRNVIELTVEKVKTDKNILQLRIPQWCDSYVLTLNGKTIKTHVINGFLAIKVKTGDNMRLTLDYPLRPYYSADGGIYYYYGPLLMVLKLNEKVEIDYEEKRQTAEFPAYTITTNDMFSYALSGYEGERAEISFNPVGNSPFWDKSYPIEIKIPARKLENWGYERVDGKTELNGEGEGIDEKQIDCGATVIGGKLTFTPKIPSVDYVNANVGDETVITLVPYGCTRLRIAVFPRFDDKI